MKKNNLYSGEYTIATTSTDGFDYEEYVEDCEINGMEPGDKDSIEYYEWCADEARNNFQQDLENIKDCTAYNIPVLVSGRLGLWWGKLEITPERKDSVYDAIIDCFSGTDEVEIKYNNGKIIVFASHHDGTNVFIINALSKKGIAKQNGQYKPCDTKRLPYLYGIY